MKIVWQNKFIFWNLIALVFIKAIFSYSGIQFASLIDGVSSFTKEEVVTQTNIFRSALGLKPVKENSVLDISASEKLQDMIKNQYFAHTSPAGISPWHWIEENQYKYSYAGENLAIGFLSPKDTVDAWANSPSHRANLTNTHYTEIGIAVAPTKINDSEGYLVVQVFGTPKPGPATAVAPVKPKATPLPTPTKILSTPLQTPTRLIPLITPAASANQNKEQVEPLVSKIDNATPNFKKTANIFNFGFIIYAFLAFLISVVITAFYGLRKDLVIRTATSFAVLILAIVIPVLQISHTALII